MDLQDLGNGSREIVVIGEVIEVAGDAPVASTLKSILQEKGIDSFTILIDGVEYDSTKVMPATFNDVDSIEVEKYVKAGVC